MHGDSLVFWLSPLPLKFPDFMVEQAGCERFEFVFEYPACALDESRGGIRVQALSNPGFDEPLDHTVWLHLILVASEHAEIPHSNAAFESWQRAEF